MESLSVVIAARDEPTLAETVGLICTQLPEDGEVVIVDDDSVESLAVAVDGIDERVRVHRPPHRIGAAGARNVGAALARGELLVFADAHVRPCDDWTSIFEPLDDPSVGAVGPTLIDEGSGGLGRGLRLTDVQLNVDWVAGADTALEPFEVPLLPGFFLGMRRGVFVDVGGFDPGFVGWGVEDVELCMHLVMLGYRCLIVPAVEVVHAPAPGHVPRHHLEWHHGLHNILRTGHVHFGSERLAQMYESFAHDESLPAAQEAVERGDAARRRAAVQAARRFDDDWLFELCASG